VEEKEEREREIARYFFFRFFLFYPRKRRAMSLFACVTYMRCAKNTKCENDGTGRRKQQLDP